MSNINITVIKSVKDNEIKTYCDIIYKRTFGVEAYAQFQDAVVAMNDAALDFQKALIKAASRDHALVRLKKEAKILCQRKTIALAGAMDIAWQEDSNDYLKEQAGFTLKKKRQRKDITSVEPPTSLDAFNLKPRGLIKITWEKAENCVTTAFEILQEDGTWKNGLYYNKESMELTFPFGTHLVIRAMTIGPGMTKSDYTEPVEVMVS